MEERHLSLGEVAEVLSKNERTIRRWIKSGKLRAYKPGRDYLIPESAIGELLEGSEVFPKDLAPPLPLEATSAPERGDSYEEAVGSTPEEMAERADALANVVENMASTYRVSLGLMSDAPAGELFALYMQASLTHVGAWHLTENEGYAGLTREGRLEAALGELSRVAEEIEQAMETAEVQEDLPDGVASLTAYQRRRATPARDPAPTGPSRRVRFSGEPSWWEQAADPTEAEAPTKGA